MENSVSIYSLTEEPIELLEIKVITKGLKLYIRAEFSISLRSEDDMLNVTGTVVCNFSHLYIYIYFLYTLLLLSDKAAC